MSTRETTRCRWAQVDDPLMVEYHDTQWGVPTYDDQLLFEMLVLEGAQAGLSWATILHKREGYRQAFDSFDIDTVADYSDAQLEALQANPEIIRNRLKIASARTNAQVVQEIQREHGSFSNYLWSWVDGEQVVGHWARDEEVPAYTELSTQISTDLKTRGMSFVGPTIIYSFLQAVGILDDHVVDCTCYTHTQ